MLNDFNVERSIMSTTKPPRTHWRSKATNSGDTQKELDVVLTFHDKLNRLALNQRIVVRKEKKSRWH